MSLSHPSSWWLVWLSLEFWVGNHFEGLPPCLLSCFQCSFWADAFQYLIDQFPCLPLLLPSSQSLSHPSLFPQLSRSGRHRVNTFWTKELLRKDRGPDLHPHLGQHTRQKLHLFKLQQVWDAFSKVCIYTRVRIFYKMLFSKGLLFQVKPRMYLPSDFLFIM